MQSMRRLLLLVVLLVVAGAGMCMVLGIRSYYLGDGFIADLEARLQEESGLDANIKGLAWEGRGLVIDKISLAAVDGAEPGFIREMSFDRITGTVPLSSWLTRSWEFNDIRIDLVTLKLGVPEGSRIKHAGVTAAAAGRPGSELGEREPFLFKLAKIRKAQVDFGGGRILTGGDLVLRRTKGKGALQITVHGGVLRLPSMPPLRLGAGSALLSDGLLEISRSDFCFAGNQGEAEGQWLMTGEMEGAVSALQGTVDLQFRLREEDLGKVLLGEWAKRLSGRIDGTFSYTSTLGQRDETLDGEFAVKGARYHAHPTLLRVMEATGDLALSEIRFERKITGELLLSGSSGRIENLDVDQRGVLAVRGKVEWARGEGVAPGSGLAGKLRLGFAPDTVSKFPGGRPPFFTPLGDRNFCWAEVDVWGSLEQLSDSLLPRLEKLGPTPRSQAP